ncbi:MAG: hypothetical protein QF743_09105 [Candidatus Marinimicrobia bacterium]|jgi:hypothetical protein|nr:hypothetical protein [Candidatus Neomarinimicrobiota bacterium]MDP6611652.1 hypothetical protein [Candidatus Neomarinimicrobiota bacterium]|tara:strand:- start:452 stop:724 length:273 start_codon:yes stop_codon:yes gene_type:complete
MEMLVIIPFVIALIIGITLLISILFQWLWNMTIPEVFGFKMITYWQAFRIIIIAAILFHGSPNDEVRKVRKGVEEINEKLEILIDYEDKD